MKTKSIYFFALSFFLHFTLEANQHNLVNTEYLKSTNSFELIRYTVKDSNIPKPFVIYEKRSKSVTQSATHKKAILILSGIHSEFALQDFLPLKEQVSLFSLDYQIIKDQQEVNVALDTINKIPQIQAHIVSAYLWIQSLPWIDKNYLSIITVSFGSFIAPSALRMLKLLGHKPYTTSFLFGGASIDAFLAPHLALVPKNISEIIIRNLSQLNPSQHLPYLTGPFFTLNGTFDEIIPRDSSEALIQSLPEPKTSVWLPTQHINLNRPDIIRMSLDRVMMWLELNQAI
jgi:hypothetical protein